ncbi:RidA family protein [Sphaerisporangium album]|uniref:RidA family protein n=1 Tax=Sphaerisporangium album TaxID=509200 RepID=A0A367EQ54_9ACTN|nr:RidA family protein [Sphaerisporangium album]RCG20103.1 RidA family protein [Sphaerisporangium album]
MTLRTIVPALLTPPGYAHAAVVETGERLAFMAGAVPMDAEGNLVGPGDPAAQARQVLGNLETALRAVGSDLSHVIASTVYVATTRHEDLLRAWEVVQASELSAGPHTSTLLGVSFLGYSGQMVEITATAVIP